MSQIIGKLVNSLVSGVNENNLSLANLSFDFALVKIEAPLEYLTVGQCLSSKRKHVAEQGQHHRTARILGALFSAVVPKAPKLRAAFGKRVSEIIKTPGTSPKGTTRDGPFEAYVGIDATSIWASATSGDPAIFVLLLACMLCRNFADSCYSVAAWVEIVRARQKEVLDSAETSGYVLNEAVAAAQQDIKREDLALFDSSVRAWLSTADSVMAKNRKQLDLILDNLSPVPVSFEEDTYSRVVRAWISAIEGLENILEGKPQQLMDGCVLLALSAWHIYPNLIVLSDQAKVVDFQDCLVPSSGAITLGFTAAEEDYASTGLRWSLTLSHLRYYGPASDSVAVDKNTRIDIQELQLMVFGAVLARWNVSPRHTKVAAACIMSICERLSEVSHGINNAKGKFSQTPYDWIASLSRMAAKFFSASGEEEREYNHLVRHGRRLVNAMTFPDDIDKAFFGLSNKHVLHSLQVPPGHNRTVEYLRSCYDSRGCLKSELIRPCDTLLVYEMNTKPEKFTVIATLTPYHHNVLDAVSGTVIQEETHVRWVIVNGKQTSLHDTDGIKNFVSFGAPQHEHVIIVFDEDESNPILKKAHRNIIWLDSPILFANYDSKIRPCTQSLENENHYCPVLNPPSMMSISPSMITIDNSSIQYHKLIASKKRKLDSSHTATDDYDTESSTTVGINLIPISELSNVIEIYTCSPHVKEDLDFKSGCPQTSGRDETLEYYGTSRQASTKSRLYHCNERTRSCNYSPAEFYTILENTTLDPRGLRSYFDHITRHSPQSKYRVPQDHDHNDQSDVTNALMKNIIGRGVLSRNLRNCLQLLNTATDVYAQFPSATFPGALLEGILTNDIESYWQNSSSQGRDISSSLRIICFFETGGSVTDCQAFDFAFAVSSGNSLYVPEMFLSDPQESTKLHLVRRIIGNLGQPGVSVLVSPANLMTKKKSADFRRVEHKSFDRSRQDSFSGVSLHLSLTDWKVPIHSGEVGLIDTRITLTEAVVSVRDKGHWVADISVMKTIPECIYSIDYNCFCTVAVVQEEPEEDMELVCIDNFEELIDPPEESAVVRAKHNWTARLAAACIIHQNIDEKVFFLPQEITCWRCLKGQLLGFEEGTIFID